MPGEGGLAALRASLCAPHPESLLVAESGLGEWGRSLPEEDAEGLLEPSQWGFVVLAK